MSFIREKLKENWILKLTAVLLAWILWLFIQGEQGTITTVTALVKVDLPSGMMISKGLPPNVQVVVRGASQDLECYIDLRGKEEGEYTVALNEDNIRFPKGLGTEVIQLTPSQLVLKLERTIQKTVPITVPYEGLAKGYEIYKITPEPDKVTIEGPRSQIAPVEEIPTEVVDLDGQTQQSNFKVRLNIKNGAIRSSINDSIWVGIDIGVRRTLYVVKGVPVFTDESPYVSSPKRADIHVMAPEALRESLVPKHFELRIDAQSLEGAAFPVKVKLIAVPTESWSDKVKISGIKPPEVSVEPKEARASKR